MVWSHGAFRGTGVGHQYRRTNSESKAEQNPGRRLIACCYAFGWQVQIQPLLIGNGGLVLETSLSLVIASACQLVVGQELESL